MGASGGNDGAGAGAPQPLVVCERRDQAFWIRINRPERRNALNDEVAGLIADGLRAAQADDRVRVVVVTGAGDRAFCAGGDLHAGSRDSPFEVDPARPENPIIELFKTFEACRLPTLARVNGHALAGGLGLMCACDIAIASRAATFGVPETGIGLFPMMILPYMMRAMPRRKLLEWCITGERWSAEEALDAELLNAVVEPDALDEAIAARIETIVARSPTAIRLGKTGFRAIEDMTIAQAFEYAQLMLPNMARTEDAREGFQAFRDKRAPRFTGR